MPILSQSRLNLSTLKLFLHLPALPMGSKLTRILEMGPLSLTLLRDLLVMIALGRGTETTNVTGTVEAMSASVVCLMHDGLLLATAIMNPEITTDPATASIHAPTIIACLLGTPDRPLTTGHLLPPPLDLLHPVSLRPTPRALFWKA